VLWFDRDQDRTCNAREIVPLSDSGVIAFEGEASTLVLTNGRGRVVDVYLSPM
jgi:hypothetical protein